MCIQVERLLLTCTAALEVTSYEIWECLLPSFEFPAVYYALFWMPLCQKDSGNVDWSKLMIEVDHLITYITEKCTVEKFLWWSVPSEYCWRPSCLRGPAWLQSVFWPSWAVMLNLDSGKDSKPCPANTTPPETELRAGTLAELNMCKVSCSNYLHVCSLPTANSRLNGLV